MGNAWTDYCLTEGVKALQANVSKTGRPQFEMFVLIKVDDHVHRINFPAIAEDNETATDIAEAEAYETRIENNFYRAYQKIRLLADTRAQAYGLVMYFHLPAVCAEVAEDGEPHAQRWERHVTIDAKSRTVKPSAEDQFQGETVNELHPWGKQS